MIVRTLDESTLSPRPIPNSLVTGAFGKVTPFIQSAFVLQNKSSVGELSTFENQMSYNQYFNEVDDFLMKNIKALFSDDDDTDLSNLLTRIIESRTSNELNRLFSFCVINYNEKERENLIDSINICGASYLSEWYKNLLTILSNSNKKSLKAKCETMLDFYFSDK